MAKKKIAKNEMDLLIEKELKKLIRIPIENIKIGDIIYVENDDETPYLVLDVGNPFVLILNQMTNFANLYKCNHVYVKKN